MHELGWCCSSPTKPYWMTLPQAHNNSVQKRETPGYSPVPIIPVTNGHIASIQLKANLPFARFPCECPLGPVRPMPAAYAHGCKN